MSDFEGFVTQYQQLVMTLIRRYYGGRLGDRAEDLAQEVWARLWDAFQKNQTNIVSFKSYLYRTVQTTMWDAIRTLDKDSQTDPLTEEHPALAPADTLHEERLALDGYLKELKPEEARLIRAHLNGFSTDEIATLMGWSEGRVRNLLTRLKKKLIDMGRSSVEP